MKILPFLNGNIVMILYFIQVGMKLIKGEVIKGTDVSDHLPVAGYI